MEKLVSNLKKKARQSLKNLNNYNISIPVVYSNHNIRLCYVKIGNVDPKPTNVSGSDGAGAADKNECNTSLTGSSIDNPNNNHSNFSPQGNLQNNSSTMNNGGKDTSNSDVQKLQEQLNDIKEQVCYFSRQIFLFE